MRWGSPVCSCSVALLMSLVTVSVMAADRALPVDRLTNGAQVRATFEPAIVSVRPLVVQVLMDDRPVALGLVASPDGLILTKASEIDILRQVTVKHGKEKWPVRALAWSEPYDLAFLKVEKSDWATANWNTAADPPVGQFLVTPGVDKTPLAVGIVSVARRAIEKDEVNGVLGVRLASTDPVIIESMFDQSAALAAGVRVGDEITRVDSVTISSRLELVREIAKHPPGETVTLEIRRDGKFLTIPVTLGHPFGEFLSRIAQQNRLGGEISRRRSGFPVAIQHDSTLKPEYCGGPVVNIDGQIVGINIARSGRTECLMIPSHEVLEVIQNFRDGKLPKLRSRLPDSPPPPLPFESLKPDTDPKKAG